MGKPADEGRCLPAAGRRHGRRVALLRCRGERAHAERRGRAVSRARRPGQAPGLARGPPGGVTRPSELAEAPRGAAPVAPQPDALRPTRSAGPAGQFLPFPRGLRLTSTPPNTHVPVILSTGASGWADSAVSPLTSRPPIT